MISGWFFIYWILMWMIAVFLTALICKITGASVNSGETVGVLVGIAFSILFSPVALICAVVVFAIVCVEETPSIRQLIKTNGENYAAQLKAKREKAKEVDKFRVNSPTRAIKIKKRSIWRRLSEF